MKKRGAKPPSQNYFPLPLLREGGQGDRFINLYIYGFLYQ
jgi:hypothetical protein